MPLSRYCMNVHTGRCAAGGVSHCRRGWYVREWWRTSAHSVRGWPPGGGSYRRSIRLVSPFAVRTLQKRLPYPQFALREREQATWVASAMSQQLAMPASALCIDYAPPRGMTAGRLRRRSGWISMFCGSWQGGCGCGWRPSYRMPVRSFSPDDCGRPGRRGGMKSTGCGRPVRLGQ